MISLMYRADKYQLENAYHSLNHFYFMKKNKRMLLTIDDIRRATAQVIGKINKPDLSEEDRKLFGQIKCVVGSISIEDGPRLQKLYRNAKIR